MCDSRRATLSMCRGWSARRVGVSRLLSTSLQVTCRYSRRRFHTNYHIGSDGPHYDRHLKLCVGDSFIWFHALWTDSSRQSKASQAPNTPGSPLRTQTSLPLPAIWCGTRLWEYSTQLALEPDAGPTTSSSRQILTIFERVGPSRRGASHPASVWKQPSYLDTSDPPQPCPKAASAAPISPATTARWAARATRAQ